MTETLIIIWPFVVTLFGSDSAAFIGLFIAAMLLMIGITRVVTHVSSCRKREHPQNDKKSKPVTVPSHKLRPDNKPMISQELKAQMKANWQAAKRGEYPLCLTENPAPKPSCEDCCAINPYAKKTKP